MRIFLTRHGETIEGQRGENLGGRKHGHLSPAGIRQAKILAKRLRAEQFDVIYSSFLRRAKDTAAEIAKYHRGTPVRFLKALRERMPGETPRETCERAAAFLNEVRASGHGTVLLVAHTGLSKAITLSLQKRSHKEWPDMPHFDNTSVSVFETDGKGRVKTLLFNDSSHLA